MKGGLTMCPACGHAKHSDQELYTETFGNTIIIQEWRERCPKCGVVYLVQDEFHLHHTTRKLLC